SDLDPAKFHGPIPAPVVVGGPTPRLITDPIPTGVGAPPVTIGVWAPFSLDPSRPPATSVGSGDHPGTVRAERLIEIAFGVNHHGGRIRRSHDDRGLSRSRHYDRGLSRGDDNRGRCGRRQIHRSRRSIFD